MPSTLLPACLLAVYLLFLLWHEPWWRRRLAPGEAGAILAGRYAELSPEERSAFQAFLDADDGRSFYMINLMEYRPQASYPEGRLPDGTPQARLTGREAGRAYNRVVVPALLKRGSYPVLVSDTLQTLLSAGGGTDFFEQLAVVRYRSRRDLLEMVASPEFQAGVPHKWASLEKTVVVPSRLMLLVDLRTLVPLALLVLYALASGLEVGWFRAVALPH